MKTTAPSLPPQAEAVPLDKAWRLLNHGPVTLITTAHLDRRNVMAAAWVMPVDFSPGEILLVLDPSTYTAELLAASLSFAVNLPRRAQAQSTYDVGHHSGRAGDKFKRFGLTPLPGLAGPAPLVADCLGWIECRVRPDRQSPARPELVFGEVVGAYADRGWIQNGRWLDGAIDTIHYIAGGVFASTGTTFRVAQERDSPFV